MKNARTWVDEDEDGKTSTDLEQTGDCNCLNVVPQGKPIRKRVPVPSTLEKVRRLIAKLINQSGERGMKLKYEIFNSLWGFLRSVIRDMVAGQERFCIARDHSVYKREE